MQREGAQEHDQRGRTGDDSAGDAEGQQLRQAYGLRRIGVVFSLRFGRAFPEHPVSMSRAGSMGVIRSRAGQAAQQHIAAQARNRDAGKDAEPRVELLGNDVP